MVKLKSFVHVNFTASTNAAIFIIFNPPSSYCLITVVCLSLLGFSFYKKLNITVFI